MGVEFEKKVGKNNGSMNGPCPLGALQIVVLAWP